MYIFVVQGAPHVSVLSTMSLSGPCALKDALSEGNGVGGDGGDGDERRLALNMANVLRTRVRASATPPPPSIRVTFAEKPQTL